MAGERTNKGMMAGIFAAMKSERLKKRPDQKLIAALEKAAYSTNPKRAMAEIAAEQILAEKPRAHVIPNVARLYSEYQAAALGKDRSTRSDLWEADHQRLFAGREQFNRWYSAVREDVMDEVNTLVILGIHNRFYDDLSEHLRRVIEAYRDLKLPWLPIIHRRGADVPAEDVIDFAEKERSILETAAIRAGGKLPVGAPEEPPLPEGPDEW